MKPISFLGYAIDQVQRGKQPSDFKPSGDRGQGRRGVASFVRRRHYRVINVARLKEAVYMLHAFQKKTRATSKLEIDIAKNRFTELMRGRR